MMIVLSQILMLMIMNKNGNDVIDNLVDDADGN